jgi:hypothetical protein
MAGRIRSIEKPMDVIRNQACDILTELTTLLHAPLATHTDTKLRGCFGYFSNLATYRLGKMKLSYTSELPQSFIIENFLAD